MTHGYKDIGEQAVKNIARLVRAYLIDVSPTGSGAWEEPSAPPSAVSLLYEPTAYDLPDRPSIAVLPFSNMSGDPEQEFFRDGQRGLQSVLQRRIAGRGQGSGGHGEGGGCPSTQPVSASTHPALRRRTDCRQAPGGGIRVLVKCVAEVPSMSSGHFWLTLAYMESGLEEQGRQQALEILRLIPDFSVSACPHLLACQDAGTRDRYASLLLTAGLPD